MAPNGSQRLPTAPYDYKHTLLLFSSSMAPTDFHLLPLRELTPQPHSQAGALQAMEARRSRDEISIVAAMAKAQEASVSAPPAGSAREGAGMEFPPTSVCMWLSLIHI